MSKMNQASMGQFAMVQQVLQTRSAWQHKSVKCLLLMKSKLLQQPKNQRCLKPGEAQLGNHSQAKKRIKNLKNIPFKKVHIELIKRAIIYKFNMDNHMIKYVKLIDSPHYCTWILRLSYWWPWYVLGNTSCILSFHWWN